MEQETKLFDQRLSYPDSDASKRLDRLVGMDDAKSRLAKLLGILVNPTSVKDWAKKHHTENLSMLDYLQRRPPLVILAGDVGTGKTELAQTIGDAVARQGKIGITLLSLSLATRGSGRVGEMTSLISAAFEEAYDTAKSMSGKGAKSKGGIIMLVDEGDALTQSRESTQMHHEDKSGVNAFIRGIDKLAAQHLPAVVILCTNRKTSIDPAVMRRAADIFEFSRPNETQRQAVLEMPLTEVGFSQSEVNTLVSLTGEKNGGYGFTYSDLTQRLLPALVLDAYPDKKIAFERAVEIADTMNPTPPFKAE